jgi:hypothetical protein
MKSVCSRTWRRSSAASRNLARSGPVVASSAP